MKDLDVNKKQQKKQLLNQKSLVPKKIAILSGSTIGELKINLEISLLKQGIKPEIWISEYNRFYEDSVFINEELRAFKPDIIYLHTTNKNIFQYPTPANTPEECMELLTNTYKKFEQAWEGIKQNYNCTIIQNNFEYLPHRLMGNGECYKNNGTIDFINRLNQKFYEYANSNSNFYISDINYQSAYYGLEKWFNMQQWYMYKYAINVEALPLVCENISNIIKSILGRNKKALAIDLDNTLWGGVIGDDDLDNIKLGIETPEGMAFSDFQKYIKSISYLGVTLNICSKNQEEIAMSGFTHKASVLKKEDFIKIKANWIDKHVNVKAIAEELNIGLDSVIFIDDNPAEREIIKKFLPEVEVPEITQPENYIRELDKLGYFEVTKLTEDDTKRNDFYKANQRRETEAESFESYEEYLKGLEMSSNMLPFNSKNMVRVTQLINKTNQFNFTTRRYTEAEIQEIMVDSQCITVAADLKDKFGDNGIVTALIAQTKGNNATIDLWIMSCRVFKRGLEFAVFDELIKQCKTLGITRIEGRYIKTKKNGLIENFYKELGFSLISGSQEESLWEYEIPVDYINRNKMIGVNANE